MMLAYDKIARETEREKEKLRHRQTDGRRVHQYDGINQPISEDRQPSLHD